VKASAQPNISAQKSTVPLFPKGKLKLVTKFFLEERSAGVLVKFNKSILGLSPDELRLMALESEEILVQSIRVPLHVRNQLAALSLPEAATVRPRLLPEYAERVAECYAYALGRASGTFARLLTQAVVASRRGKSFSAKQRWVVWATSVTSVQPFCCWNYAMRFVHEACESGSVLRDDFGKLFETNLEGWFPVWLEASDRQIHLTCLLLGNVAKKGTTDPRKRAIAFLKLNQPGIAHRNICAKLDALLDRDPKLAPPASWKVRLWTEAYDNKRIYPLVKAYLSKIPSA
jgi:hypothetical protein